MRAILAALLLLLFVASSPVLAQTDNVAENEATSNETTPVEQPARTPPPPTDQSVEQTPTGSAGGPGVLPESGQAIVKLFVLAALLESALALLFNWRPFVATLDGRAAKPLLSFLAALGMVLAFGLDDLEQLLEAYGATPIVGDGERFAQAIEAMIIAGGSSGVNSLLRTLGFRAIPSAEVEQKPPRTEAWLSVGLRRAEAVGPVHVWSSKDGELGTIHGTMRKRGLASFFLRDRGRLPQSGGKSIAPATDHEIWVEGTDKDGNALKSSKQKVKLATGALVDLEFTL